MYSNHFRCLCFKSEHTAVVCTCNFRCAGETLPSVQAVRRELHLLFSLCVTFYPTNGGVDTFWHVRFVGRERSCSNAVQFSNNTVQFLLNYYRRYWEIVVIISMVIVIIVLLVTFFFFFCFCTLSLGVLLDRGITWQWWKWWIPGFHSACGELDPIGRRVWDQGVSGGLWNTRNHPEVGTEWQTMLFMNFDTYGAHWVGFFFFLLLFTQSKLKVNWFSS